MPVLVRPRRGSNNEPAQERPLADSWQVVRLSIPGPESQVDKVPFPDDGDVELRCGILSSLIFSHDDPIVSSGDHCIGQWALRE